MKRLYAIGILSLLLQMSFGIWAISHSQESHDYVISFEHSTGVYISCPETTTTSSIGLLLKPKVSSKSTSR